MYIIDSNYNDFPIAEILALPSYLESSKRLSFSYRDGADNQEIFAYVSLKSVNDGLQILDFENRIPLSNDKFFERIKMTAIMSNIDGKFCFNYLWFSVIDIPEEKAALLLQYIDGFKYIEEKQTYIYRIERSNAPE